MVICLSLRSYGHWLNQHFFFFICYSLLNLRFIFHYEHDLKLLSIFCCKGRDLTLEASKIMWSFFGAMLSIALVRVTAPCFNVTHLCTFEPIYTRQNYPDTSGYLLAINKRHVLIDPLCRYIQGTVIMHVLQGN